MRPLAPAVFEDVVRRGRAVLTASGSRDDRWATMSAPMIQGTPVFGVLGVGDTLREERFRQRDLDLLAGGRRWRRLSVHNGRVHAVELCRQRIEQDLKLTYSPSMTLR